MAVVFLTAARAQALLLVLRSNRVLPLPFLMLVLLDLRHALGNGDVSRALACTCALVEHFASSHLWSVVYAIIIGFRLNPLRSEDLIGGDKMLAAAK